MELSREEMTEEVLRIKNGHGGQTGFMYWLTRYVYFLCKERGHSKWEPFPCHYKFDHALATETRIIVLKARQLGISWQTAAYALWKAIFHQGQNILLLSQGEQEAQKLLDKCNYIYDHLPEWQKPRLGKKNESTTEYPGLYSVINALPSTQKSGRSAGTNLVVCDEWAFHPYADKNWAALQPTLAKSARFIGISTANGRGDLFHKMWEGAKNKSNNFCPQFYGVYEHPDRDETWYEKTKLDYAETPQLLAQEYPRTETEAFISSGRCYFDTDAIAWALENIVKKPVDTADNGRVKIWQYPIPGRKYVMGVDVAQGLSRGDSMDWSSAAVYDWRDVRQVAELHIQCDPDTLADKVMQLSVRYNRAYLGVERNNQGYATLVALRNMGCPNMYYHRGDQFELKGGYYKEATPELGWPTTRRTKPIMEKTLSAFITSRGLTAYSEDFWNECLNYIIKGDGTNGAQNGTHDDRVIAHGIALQMREHAPAELSIVGPKWRMANG